jgi:hypothetical protein
LQGELPLFVTVPTMATTGFEQQASVAVGGSNVHGVPHSTVLSGEQVKTGGVVSMLVTVWLHVLLLPQQSYATQVRVMICGQVPLVTVLNTFTIGFEQQRSEATGGSKVQLEPHSTTLPGAQVSDGGVVSILVTV